MFLQALKKILIISFLIVISIFFALSLNAQGVPPIMEQLSGAEVLMDPGVGTVCFNAKRTDLVVGQLSSKADTIETVEITGHCPFSSGCDLLRVHGGGALNYVLTGAPETPTEGDFHLLEKYSPLPGGPGPEGDVNISITEEGLDSHKLYFYYGRGTPDPEPTITTELGAGGVTGVANSQQIGEISQFSFEATPPPGGTQQSCTFIAWDPYGRVFDSASLEPIPNVKVTLIDDSTKKPAIMKFEKNNDTTMADGLFNILVENEGIYSLNLDPISTHQFVKNPNLNQNYSKIFYDLYYLGGTFVEKQGIPTHHDIALQPIGNPYIAPKVEIMKVEEAMNMKDTSLFKGRVSHPFAKVCLVGEVTNKEYGCTPNSDKFGIYQIVLRNSEIPSDERLIPVGHKVDYETVNITQKIQQTIKIDSLTDSKTIEEKMSPGYEPVFSHVEGYTYNGDGIIIPKAKVDVILKSNNKIVYTTHSDSSGFFTIYSKNLPIFEYYLQIIPPGAPSAIHLTTSEFAKSNESYIAAEKLNLLTAKKNNQSIVNPVTGSLNNIVRQNNINNNINLKQTTNNGSKKIQFSFLLILIILGVLIFATFVIVVYIKKQNH
ncbi:MAG: hypothetical protein UR68_C0025G0008 [Candidatus Roizmanbacteria bacterium GW2011_GWA2_35_19]|uniref:Uncharacterized protein n=1 Tax=Candidatus Roizmanbacteria bacterium GW2011_GWA2_35_19 TaxID=1618478 RepID=A0A0G0BR51_9BACT|nr:MAG: hypothetical protein UR68_C0025G0008 [Candidatus Roizmanbacteria bacterium GW2011_GWA2_35_19]